MGHRAVEEVAVGIAVHRRACGSRWSNPQACCFAWRSCPAARLRRREDATGTHHLHFGEAQIVRAARVAPAHTGLARRLGEIDGGRIRRRGLMDGECPGAILQRRWSIGRSGTACWKRTPNSRSGGRRNNPCDSRSTIELMMADEPKSTCHQALVSAFVWVTEPSKKLPSVLPSTAAPGPGVARQRAALRGRLTQCQIAASRQEDW